MSASSWIRLTSCFLWQKMRAVPFHIAEVIPSYRVTFELVAACVKGRCLLMSDVKLGVSGIATGFLGCRHGSDM